MYDYGLLGLFRYHGNCKYVHINVVKLNIFISQTINKTRAIADCDE